MRFSIEKKLPMNWQSIDIIILTIVDLCALGVGVTILKRVTRIVHESASAINKAVETNIEGARESAVSSFAEAVGPALTKAATELLPLFTELIEEKVKPNLQPGTVQPIHSIKSSSI